jgi:two-component system, OmpR family, phosphate regulon response regulator PhoB
MARILIIEDEKDLQEVLAYNLQQDGHTVQAALRGRDGLRMALEKKPDLVLLDLMLPDLPGTEICRSLRQDPRTKELPIFMLTAKGEEIDRVVGFELGADDYMVKPFSVRELLLRIRALLRRCESGEKPNAPSEIVFGCLRLDESAHRVWVDDEEARLTALEFKLLLTLYARRNRVQSRESLLDTVWGIDAAVTTRTVDTHVKRLREKLGSAGAYVETVRGVGYRFLPAPGGS